MKEPYVTTYKEQATIFSLWTSRPQEISRRSFIQSISFAIELAGDLPEVIRTLLLVLSKKTQQYAVLKGKTFTLKNGVQILQGAIKLNPAWIYYKAGQEAGTVVEPVPYFHYKL